MDWGCSRHRLIAGDLGGADSAPLCCCCSAKQPGYDHCFLPRGKMIARMDIPCGSLTAAGNGGHVFYFTMVKWPLKVGKCFPPRAKAKAAATGYFACSCNTWERQILPVDHTGAMLYITTLHALLLYLSGSTKRCVFPSASRWLQSQHTLSSTTSAMQKVTYSKGMR